MGEYTDELPLKNIIFHCLENESNEMKHCNADGTEYFPDLLRTSDMETVIVAETATSPTKSLTLLHVAAVSECVSNDDVDVVSKKVFGVSHECLLSSSDKGSGALERLLHDKLDSFSEEGLERIAKADPSVIMALIDESGGGHQNK